MNPRGLPSVDLWVIQAQTAEVEVLFSRYLMNACLLGGQWLFVGTAGLALLAVFADWIRGATDGRPEVMIGIAVGCLLLSLLFFAVRRWLDNSYPLD
jgi:hypothetical protein